MSDRKSSPAALPETFEITDEALLDLVAAGYVDPDPIAPPRKPDALGRLPPV